MGYLRPISAYNVGKKSEFYSRKYFKEGCICERDNNLIESNRRFIEQYA